MLPRRLPLFKQYVSEALYRLQPYKTARQFQQQLADQLKSFYHTRHVIVKQGRRQILVTDEKTDTQFLIYIGKPETAPDNLPIDFYADWELPIEWISIETLFKAIDMKLQGLEEMDDKDCNIVMRPRGF
jgi:hypothetical protein